MIQIKGLTKNYKDVCAVDHLDLSIQEGELFALLGVNGAGKTSAIRMLSCILKPSQGDAMIGGFSILREKEKVKQIIGVSPQETAVAMNLTVRENLGLICGVYGFSRDQAMNKVREMAERFSLESILDKKAGKLSGGWQRRLSIAMALIGNTKVLFLDEPTLGLDVIARSELWDVIRSLKGKITIILTTHYMEEANALSDRIGIMKNGRMLAIGTADEIIKSTGKETLEEAFIAIQKEGKA
ncbi:MAG: ATP-binding cassette domain-containing protein [Clostridia bacterium]|nr:ATP-binding cassette domain-containing protein [Clostridia bacterium]MBQ4156733.1 ATP-binding cassette domain-containing protein [Clostridia bacterium]